MKWRLRNEGSNSTLMKCHCPHLGSASDWLIICLIQSDARSGYLRSDTSSVWTFSACSSDVITREASGCVAKYRMFSQDNVEKKFSEWQSQYTCSLSASSQLVKKSKRFLYKVDKRNGLFSASGVTLMGSSILLTGLKEKEERVSNSQQP